MRPSQSLASILKVSPDLKQAERQGVMLAILLRTLILIAIGGFILYAASRTGNLSGLFVISGFFLLGLAHYLLIHFGQERRWHRLLFVTLDIIGLTLVALYVPLTANGDVPQIMIYRMDLNGPLFLIVGIAALSLTPSVVVWAGAAATAALWIVFGVFVSQMGHWVSWLDLPRNPTRDQYLHVVLDPDFISSPWIESITLLGAALLLATAVARARAVVLARATAEEKREQIQSVFGRYVPHAVAEAILDDGGILHPTERTASIVFVDIEGFTTLSESLPPERLIAILNAYFGLVTEIVDHRGGVLVSYNGDAILIAFNAPVTRAAFAEEAVACGVELLQTIESTSFAGTRLRVRIGIATGPVAAGSVGGAGRQTYTVYGDTVNLAQRLETENKHRDTRLLICETTAARIGSSNRLREIATIEIRGRDQPVRVFTPG